MIERYSPNLGATVNGKINSGLQIHVYVNNITRKTNNTITFLSRNLSGCPRSSTLGQLVT